MSSRYALENESRRGVVWPPSEKLQLDYESGLSCRQLAIKYNVNKGTVSRWLKAYGISLRSISESVCKTFELFPEKLDYRQSPEYKAALSVGVLKALENDPTINNRIAAGVKASYSPERKEVYSKFKTGTTLSQSGRDKVSAARIEHLSDDANREPMRAAWRDPTKRAARVAKILQSLNCKPNIPEQKIIDIIFKNNLPYKYTGDGTFIVAGLNPDFVNVNGKKVAVEVFGDYWHGERADRITDTEQGRRDKFTEYGWDLIILWEHDINKLTEEQLVAMIP